MFYFTREDFQELNEQMEKICDKIKEIGQEIGKSCQEGADTFHDNFAYEDGERQQYMWSNRLRELIRIRNNSRVITPDLNRDTVSMGRTITIRNEMTGETKTFKVGSYMVLKDSKTISYNAPFVRPLIGAKIDETRESVIGGHKKIFKILKIE